MNVKCAILLALATLPVLCRGESGFFTIDDFKHADYGHDVIELQKVSGGTGWTGMWSVRGDVVFNPIMNLVYKTGRYVSTPGDQGALMLDSGGLATIWRNFSENEIRDGVIWISFLLRRDSVDSIQDRSGVFFATDGPGIYIGTRKDEFGLGTGEGILDVGKIKGISNHTTHLVVAQLDLENKTVKAWLDPQDCTSAEFLGEPQAGILLDSVTSVAPVLRIRLEEDGDNGQRVLMGSLRIAHSKDSEIAFAAVTCDPENTPLQPR